jgi:hypothetical protein
MGLELVDLAIARAATRPRAEALDALDEDPAVVGAVEDPQMSGPRQRLPEAPEVVVGLLLPARCRRTTTP